VVSRSGERGRVLRNGFVGQKHRRWSGCVGEGYRQDPERRAATICHPERRVEGACLVTVWRLWTGGRRTVAPRARQRRSGAKSPVGGTAGPSGCWDPAVGWEGGDRDLLCCGGRLRCLPQGHQGPGGGASCPPKQGPGRDPGDGGPEGKGQGAPRGPGGELHGGGGGGRGDGPTGRLEVEAHRRRHPRGGQAVDPGSGGVMGRRREGVLLKIPPGVGGLVFGPGFLILFHLQGDKKTMEVENRDLGARGVVGIPILGSSPRGSPAGWWWCRSRPLPPARHRSHGVGYARCQENTQRCGQPSTKRL